MYHLLLHRNIEKQLSKIPKPDAQRLADKMRSLREDPRPHQAIPLGQELYRLRVGAYRIIYTIFDADQVVFVGKVARRSEKTYRDLETILDAARRALRKN
jgi:mRNA interferase RelE/StbE